MNVLCSGLELCLKVAFLSLQASNADVSPKSCNLSEAMIKIRFRVINLQIGLYKHKKDCYVVTSLGVMVAT